MTQPTDSATDPYHAGTQYAHEHPEWYTDEHPNSNAYRIHQGIMYFMLGREAGIRYGRDDASAGLFGEGFMTARGAMNREESEQRRQEERLAARPAQ